MSFGFWSSCVIMCCLHYKVDKLPCCILLLNDKLVYPLNIYDGDQNLSKTSKHVLSVYQQFLFLFFCFIVVSWHIKNYENYIKRVKFLTLFNFQIFRMLFMYLHFSCCHFLSGIVTIWYEVSLFTRRHNLKFSVTLGIHSS